jgi:hypothetical protein
MSDKPQQGADPMNDTDKAAREYAKTFEKPSDVRRGFRAGASHERSRPRKAEERAEKAEQERDAFRDVLEELADLMDAVYRGEYKPDSFTTQPARRALSPRKEKTNGG